jgi:DNA polymerase-3 subunit alpha
MYARVTLEDFSGEITIMFMGRTFQEFGAMLTTDTVVAIKGRVNQRDDGVALHAHALSVPQITVTEPGRPVTLVLPELRATGPTMQALHDCLRRHPGDTEVRLRLTRSGGVRIFEVPLRIRVTPDFYGEVKTLLGPTCIAS